MDFYITADRFGIVSPRPLRPIAGECPGCGADEHEQCVYDCCLTDPMDYR